MEAVTVQDVAQMNETKVRFLVTVYSMTAQKHKTSILLHQKEQVISK